jgi:hypothetical protein
MYLVNILYGSDAPTEVKSSIRTPIYDSARLRINSFLLMHFRAALTPAIIPYTVWMVTTYM